jgi:GH15 family glucan-1,4-alpha-glucosidase
MQAMGTAIADRLSTPDGGVRRYEHDRYYGGNPWPVAGGWLALHQAAIGDLAGARARFDVMTKQAQRTKALMLGEQLDEQTGRWVGAFPLNWSEATYIRAALELK